MELCIVMSAMNRTGFDFVGELETSNADGIVLRNPLVLNYDENRRLVSLIPAHLPNGVVDVLGGTTLLAIPMAGIAYCVTMKDETDDWIHREYKKFFEAKEAAA